MTVIDGDTATGQEPAARLGGVPSTPPNDGDRQLEVVSPSAPGSAASSPAGQAPDVWVAPAVFLTVLVAGLLAGAVSVDGKDPSFWVWAGIVLSSVLTAGGAALTVWTHPSWRIAAAASGVITVMGLVVAGGWVWSSSRPAAWPGPVCSPPRTADVLVSPDLAATTDALAHAFALQHTAEDGCPAYLLHVTQASRQSAAAVVAGTSWDSQWSEGTATALGVPPGLWVADSTVDVAPAQEAASLGSPLGSGKSSVVAHSRLVLALPDGDAPAPGPRTWRTAVKDLAGQGRAVVRPEPGSSQVGDLSLLLDYPAGRALEGDRDFESGYARGFGSTRWRRDDLAALLRDAHDVLCTASRPSRSSRQAGHALVLPEFVLKGWATADADDSSAGTAAGCPGSDGGARPAVTTLPLTGRSAFLQLAVTQLSWPGNGPEPAGADVLADFTQWLTGSDGRAALERLGWDAGPVAGQDVPVRELSEARAAYHAARSTGLLLLGVDGSRSMARVWPALTKTVEQVLARLGPEDWVGLSTFVAPSGSAAVPATRSGPAASPGPVTPRVDPGAAGTAHRAELCRQLKALELRDGDTPLREAIPALIAQAGAGAGAGAAAAAPGTVVVFTDGASLTGSPGWPAIQERARLADVKVLVVVLGATDVSAGLPVGLPVGQEYLTYLQAPGGAIEQDLLRTLNGMLWRSPR